MFTFTTKNGTTITVSAVRGNKPANWQPSGKNYLVTISVNGKRASFDFWDSVHNMRNRIGIDLRGALACFASDAFAGMNASSAADIMEEFGYTEVKDARRVFKGVKQAEEQAAALGLTDDDLSELADY